MLIRGKVIVGNCERCGYMSSNKLCKACVLLEGLNRGLPKLGIANESKIRKQHGEIKTPAIQNFKQVTQTNNSCLLTEKSKAHP